MPNPPSAPRARTYNASDQRQIDSKARDSKLKEEQRLNGLRQAMQQPDGRAWVRGIIERSHIFNTSFTGTSQTFFNEGERNQALKILADLSVHCVPEMLVLFAENAPDARLALQKALAILTPIKIGETNAP